jgi:hypothetical protein
MKTLISSIALGSVLLVASTAWAAAAIFTPPLFSGNASDAGCAVLNVGTHDAPDVTMEIRNNDNNVVSEATNAIRAGEIETIGLSAPSGTIYCRVSGISKARVTLCLFDAGGIPLQCVTGE